MRFRLDYDDPAVQSKWFTPKRSQLFAAYILGKAPSLGRPVFFLIQYLHAQSQHPYGSEPSSSVVSQTIDGTNTRATGRIRIVARFASLLLRASVMLVVSVLATVRVGAMYIAWLLTRPFIGGGSAQDDPAIADPAYQFKLLHRFSALGWRTLWPFALHPHMTMRQRFRYLLEVDRQGFFPALAARLLKPGLGQVDSVGPADPDLLARLDAFDARGSLQQHSPRTTFLSWLPTASLQMLPSTQTGRDSSGVIEDVDNDSFHQQVAEAEARDLFAPLRTKSRGQRSILFLNNSYYHFYYLAKALRERGWHAHVVCGEDPESDVYNYYHGEDINYFHPNPTHALAREKELFNVIAEVYDMVHYYSDIRGHIVFGGHFKNAYNFARDEVPWDFTELRQRGIKIGFSCAGCLTLTAKSAFYNFTGGVCETCAWRDDSKVCSDEINLAAATTVSSAADLICSEAEYTIGVRGGPKGFREPLTYCLDEHQWNPDLDVPEDMKFDRSPDEILVMHSVGNYDMRTRSGDNIKGTKAVVEAVERLRAEGYPVRLVFKTNVPSKDMRFYQVQADILVDQLRYGRYGATAREAMMLGKPTLCAMNPRVPIGQEPLRSISECPLINASPETVYAKLKWLIENEDER